MRAFLALPLLLAACATAPTPAPVRVARPAIAAPAAPPALPGYAGPAGLDGRWFGQARLLPNQVAGDVAPCIPAVLPVAMTVNGGRAALSVGRGVAVEGGIDPDGAVGFGAAQGRFSGRSFSGDVNRGSCSYRMNLTRRGR